MAVSPYTFQGRYKNLKGSGVPPKKTEADRFGFTGIHCDRYIMTNNDEFNTAQPLLNRVAGAAGTGNADHNRAIFNVRYGKGSPAEMETVLRLAIETGVVEPKPDALQKFADGALGVDCTGLASSYYEQFDADLNKTKTNVGCGYYYRGCKTRGGPFVWAGDYAEAGDCLLWMHADGQESRKPGHIAVIESATGSELYAVQSGSTKSGGPSRVKYTIDDIVHRKTGKDGFPEAFYLRLVDIDPITGTKAEVILVRPYYVA